MSEGTRSLFAFWLGGASSVDPPAAGGGVRSLLAFWMGGAANNNGTPPVTRDTGGSGHKGSGRRRNLNDDPEAFAELLKEWREKSVSRKHIVATVSLDKPVEVEGAESAADSPLDGALAPLLDELRQAEISYDRSMAAYEAALVKLEQVRSVNARNAAFALEEMARQLAIQQAIEWEMARLAYEDFLDDEDDVMLLTA